MKFSEYKVDCTFKPGKGDKFCGKPYLRNPIRKELGKTIEGKHVEAYLYEQARNLNIKINDPEPPIIRKRAVLQNIKTEHRQSK